MLDRFRPRLTLCFDEIGWPPDIRTAIHLGKDHNRPIFLLTVDMRAGPLSDRRVIGVLNRSFVSVYINNQDYDSKGGSAPAEERAELQRIHQEGYAKKLSMGTVRGFMLTPDAHTYDIVTPPMLATPRAYG